LITRNYEGLIQGARLKGR